MHPDWEHAKQAYRSPQPPEGFSGGVEEAIRRGDRTRRRRLTARRSLTTALAACACFVLLVNASPTFAQAVSGVPVLGPLARVFTVAEYTAEDDGLLLDVRLPGLENTGNEALEERVNAEITTRVQALLDEAQHGPRRSGMPTWPPAGTPQITPRRSSPPAMRSSTRERGISPLW